MISKPVLQSQSLRQSRAARKAREKGRLSPAVLHDLLQAQHKAPAPDVQALADRHALGIASVQPLLQIINAKPLQARCGWRVAAKSAAP